MLVSHIFLQTNKFQIQIQIHDQRIGKDSVFNQKKQSLLIIQQKKAKTKQIGLFDFFFSKLVFSFICSALKLITSHGL